MSCCTLINAVNKAHFNNIKSNLNEEIIASVLTEIYKQSAIFPNAEVKIGFYYDWMRTGDTTSYDSPAEFLRRFCSMNYSIDNTLALYDLSGNYIFINKFMDEMFNNRQEIIDAWLNLFGVSYCPEKRFKMFRQKQRYYIEFGNNQKSYDFIVMTAQDNLCKRITNKILADLSSNRMKYDDYKKQASNQFIF